MTVSRHPQDPAPSDASIQLGIITLDAGLVIRGWNASIAAWTGIPPSQAQGRPLTEAVPSIVTRGLVERFDEVLATGQVRVLASAFHRFLIPCPPVVPSAHYAEMQQRVTLGPLRDHDRVVGVIVTIEDVTSRLDAERTLAQALRSGDASARETAARALARVDQLADPSPLTSALRDEDWRVRGAAVRALTRHADRDTLVALLQDLRTEHADFDVLNSALQLLAASDIDVTSSLAELLEHPDPDLRMQAALALGQQDRAGAAGPLIGLLGDADVNVRFHAIEALGRLRAADAVDPLVDIASSGDFFLAFPAIDALAAIGDGRVAPRLTPLLSDPELADAVAGALGELGEADVVPALIEALNAGLGGLAVIRALARLYARYERHRAGSYVVDLAQRHLSAAGNQRVLDAVTSAGPDDLPAVVLLLGWLRGAAVERALTRLLARPDLRGGVIEAIVRQGAGVVDLLVDQVDRAEDPDTRGAAVAALSRLGDRRAVPALLRALDADRKLAAAAAAALAAIGDAAAFEPLLAHLGHPDASIRQAVIGALNSLGHPDMPVRVRLLLDSDDPAVRESAVRIAGYFGYADCTEALLQACHDPDEPVRRAALEQLPNLDAGERALLMLARALSEDTPRARASAAQALSKLPGAASLQLLLEATRDGDPWVRYFAVRGLAQHDDEAVTPRLGELAGEDAAIPVRLAAIEALGTRRDTAAAEVLLPHAAGADPVVSAAALTAIGAVEDVRAETTLLSALRSADAHIRSAAVAGMSRRSTTAFVEALKWTAGGDPDPSVARTALGGLAQLSAAGGASADPAILALLALTADPRQRDEALDALGRVRHRIPTVASGLRAGDPEVRRSAVEALSRLHDSEATTAIRTALADTDRSVRLAAVVALHRLGARGLEPVFTTIARDDPAREVRQAAAAALSQNGGPSPPPAPAPDA